MADKRYYWIKIKSDFFDLPTIDWLQDQKNGCEYIVLYQKLCLLSANSGGELVRKIGDMIIPYDVKKIAEVTRFKFDTVVVAMELYKKIGLIVEREDGVFVVAGIGEMVGSETKWAEKKRLQRDKGGDNVPRLSQKFEDKKGQVEDNVPRHVPHDVPKSAGTNERTEGRTQQGTSAPTLSGKSIELRDQSIELREKRINNAAAAARTHTHTHAREAPAGEDRAEIVQAFCDNLQPGAGSMVIEQLHDLIDTYGGIWCMEATREAARSGGRSIQYVLRILQRWEHDGFKAQRKKGGGNYGSDIGTGNVEGTGTEKSAYAAYLDGDTVKRSPYDLGGTPEEGGDPADDWSTARDDPYAAGASPGGTGGRDQKST
ncbi:phage replisome organizer N-terminal domain-containing protein [uncultured Mitsuokella sp.]|uniref:phage replisome organizer N-terminal domain-containing protein n=1 Tax=uncultured Mitsuokella sp. TaxID=453120 RepID=UPI00261C9802|nr:phage replisome organizer N-terminal domain-containing protein [uncultured Mitsuokella sp.]